jgi:hypothetical protein
MLLLALVAFSANAQTGAQASIEGMDQLSLNGTVVVPRVVTDEPAFVVIYNDDGAGGLGQVIGQTAVSGGEQTNVSVVINSALLTPTLHAVIHTDDNEIGTFEFGTVEDADAPIMVNDAIMAMPFTVQTLMARDQIVSDQVTISSVTVSEPTWVVIHAGDAQNIGEPIGHALIPAGTTTNLTIDVEPGTTTPILWPVLHTDTGTQGQFDFGTVEGADTPLVVGDTAATMPISTTPIIRVAADQLILDGSGVVTEDTASIVIGSALADGPSFLVVHADDAGNLGPMIGFTAVPDGLSNSVTVDIDAAQVTPTLWVTLHTDDNEIGTFEFGTVENADMLVMVNEQPVRASVQVAPFMSVARAVAANNQVTFDRVLVDQPAFVVLHEGGPMGPVLAQQPLSPGLNTNITLALDLDAIEEPVFPVLHADTNLIGTLEFDSPNGVDAPILLNGNPIATTLDLSTLSSEAAACSVLANADTNLFSTASTDAQVSGTLARGESIQIVGQMQVDGGLTWWQTADGLWLPSEAVSEQAACENLPTVIG